MKQKEICAAVLANVDAGKTTLAEQILLKSGMIRSAGRVDHGDSFLDNHELERKRGITIFSKMARLKLGDRDLTLLDTPGHVDFSAETERTLQIADCAILLVSAADGVTGHSLTLWKLLERFHLPTIIFVNKMDQPGAEAGAVMEKLQAELDERCISFSSWAGAIEPGKRALQTEETEESPADLEEFYDSAAMCDEEAMEIFLEQGFLTDEKLRDLFEKRSIFPVLFGSALKGKGVAAFLNAFYLLAFEKEFPDEFGARCYKISRDEKGQRLTWLRITGGSLRARSLVTGNMADMPAMQDDEEEAEDGDTVDGSFDEGSAEDEPDTGMPAARGQTEKLNQIRLYSGVRFTQTDEIFAGQVAAVTGLSASFCGQTYGSCPPSPGTAVEPVLSYDLVYPPEVDRNLIFEKLRELAEEIPEISPVMDAQSGAIHVKVMGEVQTQILQSLVHDRFGYDVDFGDAQIVYRESIITGAEGVGHFEPLRHYAEVHLLLEPGERGSGIVYSSDCPTDTLARNWQNLALSTLRSHRQLGVLTGSELTDIRVTLISGRSHIKHTMGGDFRQAARRALRQGLMKCESILLEPYYRFSLYIPEGNLGRALLDIDKAAGHVEAPVISGSMAHLTGTAPVSTMRNYQAQVRAYSSGRGSLELTAGGYGPCHNPDEVIAEKGYEPDRDLRNPTWSVFCAHGSGFEVPWDQVEDYMHLPLRTRQTSEGLVRIDPDAEEELILSKEMRNDSSYERYRREEATAAELDAIFERTYGPGRRRIGESLQEGDYMPVAKSGGGRRGPVGLHRPVRKNPQQEYLLVDGYNIIFAWEDLRDLAHRELGAARTKLADLLCNYQGYRKMNLILVFDAYRVEGGREHTEKYHNIYIVYTREAETADRYIEKAVHRAEKGADITVATSDQAEQVIIWGAGARRMSARELLESMKDTEEEMRTEHLSAPEGKKNLLFDSLPEELAEKLEDVRLGKRSIEDV